AVHHHFRFRQRHRRAWRWAGRRVSRSRSAICAQISGLFSDCGFRRRARQRCRRLLRLAASGRALFCPQALSVQGRIDLHLRPDNPDPALAAAGPVWKENNVSAEATPVQPGSVVLRLDNRAARALVRRHYLRWWETLPWLAAAAFYFAFPAYLGFGTALLITILFALSLDLALGYAGIVTLGHAAFFGAGAYTVGLLAFHGIWTEPITSLLLAALAAAAIGLASGLVLLRTQGLTLLMLTLCTMALLQEAANMAHNYTGGFD